MRLLAMSGFVPEQICDTVRFNGYTGDRNITHYCGYANDYISQVIQDDTVNGAVFPRSCDSSRIIKSYIGDSGKFIYQLNVPARNGECAVSFFADVIKDYSESVEKYFNISIDDEDIKERIELCNKRNMMIMESYNRLEEVSYGDYIRNIHRSLANPLSANKVGMEVGHKVKSGHKVYLVGSYLANEGVADIIEDAGLSIVGDNLPESGRLAGSRASSEGDLYLNIAKEILGRRLSPTQDNFSMILDNDLDEIRRLGCRAVIFVTQKYCEPYDYLYPAYRKMLDREGIPSLRITLNDSEDDRKVSLAVEAFADTI